MSLWDSSVLFALFWLTVVLTCDTVITGWNIENIVVMMSYGEKRGRRGLKGVVE